MISTFELVGLVVSQQQFDEQCDWTSLNESIVVVNGIPIQSWGEYKIGNLTYQIIDFEPESTGDDDVYLLSLARPLN